MSKEADSAADGAVCNIQEAVKAIDTQNERYAELLSHDFSRCQEMGSIALRSVINQQLGSYASICDNLRFIPEYDEQKVAELKEIISTQRAALGEAKSCRDERIAEINKLSELAKSVTISLNFAPTHDIQELSTAEKQKAEIPVNDLERSIADTQTEISRLGAQKSARELTESLSLNLLSTEQMAAIRQMIEYRVLLDNGSGQNFDGIERQALFLQGELIRPAISWPFGKKRDTYDIYDRVAKFVVKSGKPVTFETLATQIHTVEIASRSREKIAIGHAIRLTPERHSYFTDSQHDLHTGWLKVDHSGSDSRYLTRVYATSPKGEKWSPPVYNGTGKYTWDELIQLESATTSDSGNEIENVQVV